MAAAVVRVLLYLSLGSTWYRRGTHPRLADVRFPELFTGTSPMRADSRTLRFDTVAYSTDLDSAAERASLRSKRISRVNQI